MESILKYICDNKEWIFSGMGVSAFGIIVTVFLKKRQTSKKISSKSTGASYLAEKMTVNNSTGLTYVDVKEIAKSVFLENFPKLQEVARLEAEKNRDLFISELDKKIQEKLSQEEINKFNNPDIQFALKNAIVTAARRDNEETRKILCNLIIDRVKNDGIEFKELVYNEAIETIPQLTKNHLDILAFTFTTRYSVRLNVNNLDELGDKIKEYWIPFIDFYNSNAQFQHLEYAACANTGFGLGLETMIRKGYSNIFLKSDNLHINAFWYDSWNIQNELKPLFFKLNDKGNEYCLVQSTLTEFENKYYEILNTNINTYSLPYTALLECIKSESEIRDQIINRFDFGEYLFDRFNKTPIQSLNLTSVGIVIGASHFESTTGDKIEIDLWIN